MKRQLKRWAAILLSCCIALSVCSMAAFAAGSGEFDPAGNLLHNPGMEEGGDAQDEWSYDGNTMFLCITNGSLPIISPHSGDYSIGYIQSMTSLPTYIYQDVEIPESGMYEFSGYFATAAGSVTMQAGDQQVSFSSNDRVWEKKSLLFYADAGETIRIELTSFDPSLVGFWMDDVCLTRCEGTAFDGLDEGWALEEGIVFADPGIAMQGEGLAYLQSGERLRMEGPALDAGEYTLSFYVRTLDENPYPCEFFTDLPMSGESFATEVIELADQWKNITLRFTLASPSMIAFTIDNPSLPEVYIDNVAFVQTEAYAPTPTELLRNPGFESDLAGWSLHQGSAASSIFVTDSQARSGQKALFVGYFAPEAMASFLSQDCPAGAGRYAFTAYLKTELNLSGKGAVLVLEAKDANGKILASAASTAVSSSNGGWVPAIAVLNAPAGTKTVTAKIGGLSCTGGFFVDDASLRYAG